MCNSIAGAGLQNPALCAPGGGQASSGAFSMALAISISSSSGPGAGAQAEAAAAGGKAGKAGKHGKNGKAGKHGKNGKNGKNNQSNPLQNNASLAIAMAMAGAGSQAQGCNPMGQMGGAGQLGGMDQQQMLLGLMVGLMLANSQNNAAAGANPGMGGFLNQFGRCGF